MPEGDTIHRASREIAEVLEGRVPEEILTPHPRHGADHWPERLAGRAVRSVDAHGKHLFIRFDGALTLHSHLRTTGAWGVHREGARWKRSPRRAWLVLRSRPWAVVQFDGPVLELVRDSRTRFDRKLVTLGQDVIGERFDEAAFLRRLRAEDPGREIADALLDQRVIAGIGNAWKSEACFAAAVDPWLPLAEVADERVLAIVRFARAQMRESAEGSRGRPRAVYRRVGMPCRNCGERIRARGQGEANRRTYWCPSCQR